MDIPRSLYCDWIFPILSSIAHPSLETVTMVIHFDHIEQIDEIDPLEFSALDTFFMNPPLSNNSTKLCLCISDSSDVDREVFRATLKDRLPKLDGRKRLEFKFNNELISWSLLD